MKKRLFPFWLWPYSWGLPAKQKAIAKAEYYLEGEELDRELVALSNTTSKAKEIELLHIDFKYGKITEYEYDVALAKTQYDPGLALDLKLADIDLKHHKINEREHSKRIATLRKLPWVDIIKIGLSSSDISTGEMELDWNEYFIEELHEYGYVGRTDEEVVNLWLSTLCKNIALDEFGGMGSVDDLSEDNDKIDSKENYKREVK
ncbi:hypothetical protein EST35_0324 [Pseudomonas phage vB_PaeM_PA5oct]|uniref:Uncharacterized protein n=1 Tax=Pseudomonas phage vB_PaeM_PA5oct TaxID=2163605 RepID=A0A4Y5JV40_9CAUD|nr:virion structural protein [Pseudomonas phage vB_PaeM_PA5oct]QCG76205.1 hypothetical protein EST35_0324 [Pseudomonas phage vB_PaeM_PA5oct]WPK40353.1 virion structural protein [Pseudomonas phage Paride]